MIDIVLGILISLLGFLILISRILDTTEADNVSDKSARGQLYVIGVGLIIAGIIYATR